MAKLGYILTIRQGKLIRTFFFFNCFIPFPFYLVLFSIISKFDHFHKIGPLNACAKIPYFKVLYDCIKHIAIRKFGNHHHIFLLFINFSPAFSGPSFFNFPICRSLKTSGKTILPVSYFCLWCYSFTKHQFHW